MRVGDARLRGRVVTKGPIRTMGRCGAGWSWGLVCLRVCFIMCLYLHIFRGRAVHEIKMTPESLVEM